MGLALLGPTPRNLLTVSALTLIIVITHIIFPDVVLRYAAYLAIFSIWMAWFVVTFVDYMAVSDR